MSWRNPTVPPSVRAGALSSGSPIPQDLSQILRLIIGYRSAKTLLVAVSLDVFEQFRSGPRPSDSVARSLGLDGRACALFLEALAAMGYLEKGSGGYANTLVATQYLLKDSPRGVFHNLRYQDLIWDAWSDLKTILKLGHPPQDLVTKLQDPRFTETYILGMREVAHHAAEEVAERLAAPDLRRLLDVGAGPGSYSLALLRKCAALRSVLLDLPGTLQVTRSVVSELPEADRIEYRASDYHAADFGSSSFNLVLLSHVTHDEGEEENRRLLKKSFDALAPGGRVAIHDFVVGSGRNDDVFGSLFSLHLLAYTTRGRLYSEAEYEAWLRDAGFGSLERHVICGNAEIETMLLTGIKA
jgi:3-hydroxy-5-methyl-1-naphthoate 3-O-methyltransferase